MTTYGRWANLYTTCYYDKLGNEIKRYAHVQKDIVEWRMALYLKAVTKPEYLEYYNAHYKKPQDPNKTEIPKADYDPSKIHTITGEDVESVFGETLQSKLEFPVVGGKEREK